MKKIIPILVLLFSSTSITSMDSIAEGKYVIQLDSYLHQGDLIMAAFLSMALTLYIMYLIDVSIKKRVARYTNEADN